MASAAILRAVACSRPPCLPLLPRTAPRTSVWSSKLAIASTACTFSSTAQRSAGSDHDEETFEEFTARYEKEFENVQDVFELQRNLNNSFAYDLVPSTSVIVAALKAARRVNDFPTAVRIFEGIKAKVENRQQYEQYLEELEPLRKEMGVELKETLYPGLP